MSGYLYKHVLCWKFNLEKKLSEHIDKFQFTNSKKYHIEQYIFWHEKCKDWFLFDSLRIKSLKNKFTCKILEVPLPWKNSICKKFIKVYFFESENEILKI